MDASYFVCLEFVGALPPFIVLSFASLPAQVCASPLEFPFQHRVLAVVPHSNTISSPVLRLAVKQITIKEKEVDTSMESDIVPVTANRSKHAKKQTILRTGYHSGINKEDRRLFWGVGGTGALAAYEQATLQAIKFLQGLYGFMVMFLFGYSTLKNMYGLCMRSTDGHADMDHIRSIQWRWRHLPEKRGGYPSKGRCDGGGRHPRPNHRSKAAILFHSINRRSPESVDDRDPQTTVLYVTNLSHKFGFPRHTSSVYSQF
uniref:Uncharacterized protein n=1 Tax=Aegilops tauschii TaxID=37682 RepID=M8CPG6_AEGTA